MSKTNETINNPNAHKLSMKYWNNCLNASGCHIIATPASTEKIVKTSTAPAAQSFAILPNSVCSFPCKSTTASMDVLITSAPITSPQATKRIANCVHVISKKSKAQRKKNIYARQEICILIFLSVFIAVKIPSKA